MTAGAESAYLQKQVERVLKALSGRFDLASAMGVEGFADVFGPVLERRAEESRKRPRSEGIPAAEPSVTALGVQPRQSGSTQHAAEAIGLSNSSHAARPPSRDTDSSQAVEEDAGQQVQPTLKKARTAKGKEVARDKRPVATVAQKSRSHRGQIPPQMSENGTEASERDVDKVVSGLVSFPANDS